MNHDLDAATKEFEEWLKTEPQTGDEVSLVVGFGYGFQAAMQIYSPAIAGIIKSVESLESSVWAADTTEQDVIIKDLRSQTKKILKQLQNLSK